MGEKVVGVGLMEEIVSLFLNTEYEGGERHDRRIAKIKAIEEKFRSVSQFSQENRKFARFFFAGATICEVDKQGRILLPAVLREFASIEKEVVLAGVLSHIEIWSKERWENAVSYDDMDEIAEHMAELGFGI